MALKWENNYFYNTSMMDINIKTPFKPNFKVLGELSYLLYDGKSLEYLYTEDHDITNKNNHVCRQLVKKYFGYQNK